MTVFLNHLVGQVENRKLRSGVEASCFFLNTVIVCMKICLNFEQIFVIFFIKYGNIGKVKKVVRSCVSLFSKL